MAEYLQRRPDGSLPGLVAWPDRMSPPRSSRIHFHLTSLRAALERAIGGHVAPLERPLLLDFGCGEMPYRTLFESLGATYLGFDLEGNARADGCVRPDGTLARDAASVDVVLSSQVLEHVEDPALYLQEAFRVLRGGGLLLLSTHGVWRYHPDPTDYWRWTGPGLRKMLAVAGFEVVSFEGVVGPQATAIQLWQDAVLPRVPVRWRGLFCRACQWRMRRADRRCPPRVKLDDAQVFVAVARRPAAG